MSIRKLWVRVLWFWLEHVLRKPFYYFSKDGKVVFKVPVADVLSIERIDGRPRTGPSGVAGREA